MPVRDLVAVGVWMASFAGHTVTWRGDRFELKKGSADSIVVSALHRARSFQRRDFSSLAETILFSAPVEVSARVTDRPRGEAQKIAHRIKPAIPYGLRIARHAPSHDNRLEHSIHTGQCDEADTERPMPERSRGNQSQNPEWHRIGETRACMSCRTRIAGALHPSQLIAQGTNHGAEAQHVANNVVRKITL